MYGFDCQEVKSWLPGFPRATVAFSLAVKMAMQLQDLELALRRELAMQPCNAFMFLVFSSQQHVRLYEETCNVIKLSVVTYNTLIEVSDGVGVNVVRHRLPPPSAKTQANP